MSAKLKAGLKFVLTGAWFLFLSALLMLAVNEALRLRSLYAASISPGSASDLNALAGPRIDFWIYALVAAILTLVLFVVVLRHPLRLLLASALMLLVFGGLNLYSGRHLLPQVLIPPRPPALLQKYAQALAAHDLQAALSLTDGSEECAEAVAEAFLEHQSVLQQRLGPGWRDDGINASPRRRFMTYYDQPVPTEAILQPVPTHLFRLLVRTEGGRIGLAGGPQVQLQPLPGSPLYLWGGHGPRRLEVPMISNRNPKLFTVPILLLSPWS